MLKFLANLLDSNEKQIQKLRSVVNRINELEAEVSRLKDTEFKKQTENLVLSLQQGKSLDELLPKAYALVREAAKRTINERHYDVQLTAGIVLHQGKVAEQKTGEGKTLSASLPLYLNALTKKGVHLVTVNDYLARVGVGWMGSVYQILGLSVSAIIHDKSYIYDPLYLDAVAQDWRLRHLKPINRKEAYQADIVYGVNSEYGFDYLRDNMISNKDQTVQREHNFAIVDEVDSVLIDEARTPHIISAPDTEPTNTYYDISRLVGRLNPETDFTIDEKLKTAHLNEHGITQVENILGISNLYEKDFETVHLLEAALKARSLYHKEKDYIVKDNEVVIVDEFTGRLLPGRRYSEGLHQAIEAKERVPIQQESRTLATVSLQNYFRMYKKLAGMTGTAVTEAEEFHKIYNLDVVVIPTHRPMIRKDHADMVYKTTKAKYMAVANEVLELNKAGTPVLVGTTSIEKNELISELLLKKGVPHEVLNAKNHEKEALIISEAGKEGAVTVATNMAGRGVDIILGGAMPVVSDAGYKKNLADWQKKHDKVVSLGGLHVIGTERHESRRIDNQLRGRSGRQGDPGSSRFFVSLEDDLMRLFGGDQVAKLMTIFKLPDDIPLEHGMVSKAIEQAQIKVEGFHFDSRKHLVEYDDVLNKQREIVYKRRHSILEGIDIKQKIIDIFKQQINIILSLYAFEKGEIQREKIVQEFAGMVPFDEPSQKQLVIQLEQLHTNSEIEEFLNHLSTDLYSQRENQFGEEIMRQIEQWVSLTAIDNLWMSHLDAIDDLREGIGLRGYGQRDPLIEYKNEAFSMFERLIDEIDKEIAQRIFRAQVQVSGPMPRPKLETNVNTLDSFAKLKDLSNEKPQSLSVKKSPTDLLTSLVNKDSKLVKASRSQLSQRLQSTIVSNQKLGRNDPCPCGSGKKWKKCHYPQIG